MESFHYAGFTPSDALRAKCELTLTRILDKAPSDASVTAHLQQEENRFRCTLEIGSASCPISVETNHKFAAVALAKAEVRVMRRLARWRELRFGFSELDKMPRNLKFLLDNNLSKKEDNYELWNETERRMESSGGVSSRVG